MLVRAPFLTPVPSNEAVPGSVPQKPGPWPWKGLHCRECAGGSPPPYSLQEQSPFQKSQGILGHLPCPAPGCQVRGFPAINSSHWAGGHSGDPGLYRGSLRLGDRLLSILPRALAGSVLCEQMCVQLCM